MSSSSGTGSGGGTSQNMDQLLQDLSMEKRVRDDMDDANSDIEKSITDLEAYVTHLDTVTNAAEDNEWRSRYECQAALNVHLSDHKRLLEQDLAELRWKFHQGSFPDAMNFNLNLMTEAEQQRLVKQMERLLKKCYKTVQDAEYKIDAEGKEFIHYDGMRRKYRVELKHASKCREKNKLEEICERRGAAGSPQLYSSSYINWLDEHALDDPQAPKTDEAVNGNPEVIIDQPPAV